MGEAQSPLLTGDQRRASEAGTLPPLASRLPWLHSDDGMGTMEHRQMLIEALAAAAIEVAEGQLDKPKPEAHSGSLQDSPNDA